MRRTRDAGPEEQGSQGGAPAPVGGASAPPSPVVGCVRAVLPPLLAGVLSLAVSWQRWIDPFIDSGRELIVPARLAAGERLYLDVAYNYGPAAPWIESVALRLFGHRFVVLEGVCLLLTAALLALAFRLVRRAGGELAAVVATTSTAALCLGAPFGGAFVFP